MPLTVAHLALHLSKDAGLLAAAAEKMDHPEEHDEGWRLFCEWLVKRMPNVRKTCDLLSAAHTELRNVKR